MSAYKYKAYDRSGSPKSGEITASSLEEAENRLSALGDTVVSIIPILEKKGVIKQAPAKKQESNEGDSGSGQAGLQSLKGLKFGKKKPKASDVAAVLRNLAVMTESGVPFYEGLQAVIVGVENETLKEALDKVRQGVMGGRSLGSALREAQDVFPGILCDIVSVGEENGKLDKALASAANYLERAVALKQKLINALIYPCVLMGMAGFTVFALIFFIMPRFSETFKGMNVKPPMITQLLMDFGTGVTERPLVYLGVIAALWFGGKYAMKQPPVRDRVIRISRRIPVMGIVLRQLSVARMLQTLSSLLSGGVTLMSALHHSSKVSGDPEVESACERALSDVEKGGMLSESFAETKVLPPTIVQMMAVGERTGQLAPLISRAAEEMEIQADMRLKSLMSVFEPMMILVMGAVIGLITLSLIAPLFTVLQNVQ